MNQILTITAVLACCISGCIGDSVNISHKQLLQSASKACSKKYQWRDAFADPNLVVIDDNVLVQVYPDYATSVEGSQHPENALVTLRLDGTVVSVAREWTSGATSGAIHHPSAD